MRLLRSDRARGDALGLRTGGEQRDVESVLSEMRVDVLPRHIAEARVRFSRLVRIRFRVVGEHTTLAVQLPPRNLGGRRAEAVEHGDSCLRGEGVAPFWRVGMRIAARLEASQQSLQALVPEWDSGGSTFVHDDCAIAVASPVDGRSNLESIETIDVDRRHEPSVEFHLELPCLVGMQGHGGWAECAGPPFTCLELVSGEFVGECDYGAAISSADMHRWFESDSSRKSWRRTNAMT